MKAVIYVRVSRNDQDYDRQISDLKYVAIQKGWEVVEIIKEKASGAKLSRSGIDRLLKLCETGQVRKVLVSEVSRLGRNTLRVLEIIDKLTSLQVSVYIHNFAIETLQPSGAKNSMVSMILTILAEFASMERENLIERTKSGLKEARTKGVQLGRPVGSKKTREQFLTEYKPVVKLIRQGLSVRNVAKLSDLSVNTVLKIRQAL